MKNIATFDIETDPFDGEHIPEPFAAGFYDGQNYYEFWGKDCLQKCLHEMLNFEGIIYAHNGGGFDFHYLYKILDDLDQWKMLCKGKRIMSMKKDAIEFRDSFLILPAALKKFGSKMDIDINKLHKTKRQKNKAEILAYLRQDCLSLHSVVSKFIENYGLGLTIRNRAFSELARCGIPVPQSETKSHDAIARQFYFGGRCEVFESGHTRGKIDVFDINSAYPYAMTLPHFWGENHEYEKHTKLKHIQQQDFVIVECVAKGCFPHREETGMEFPNDDKKRIYYVSGWEYCAARELELLSQVKVWEVYRPKKTQSFSPFVNKFFKIKSEAEKSGDKAMREIAKIFLNSAYGGFALDPENFVETKFYRKNEDCAEGFKSVYEEGDWKMCEKSKPGDTYFNCWTAASITGFVRAYLLKAIKSCDRVLYCDTDSIFSIGKVNLKISSELGAWKFEGEFSDSWIAGKKLYCLKHKDSNLGFKTASKGVSATPQEIQTVAMNRGIKIKISPLAPTYSLKREWKHVSREIQNTGKI